MKFKLLAIAAVLAASGAANAALIDNGVTGNGNLYFSIWDASNSYTLNLNETIDSFQSNVSASGLVDLSWAADAKFTNFMSTADLASLQFNVVAGDNNVARRVLTTFSGVLPATTKTADVIRNTAGAVQGFANAVNTQLSASVNSTTFAVGAGGYAGGSTFSTTIGGNLVGSGGFSNGGTLANNSYANGLNFARIDGASGGVNKSTYTAYTDGPGLDAVRVYLDGTNTLHIASVAPVTPVPEPENIAMLMAGLGLMGAIARRRNKKSA